MLVYERARDEARKIRRAIPIGNDFKGLLDVASKWEAEVNFVPLRHDVSGFIIKEEKNPPRIYINSHDSEHRQRFTLAHEIGHLVERQVAKDGDYSFTDFRSNGDYDLHEFFADEFAGELLMPAGKLITAVKEGGTIKAAADFNVSVPAVERRLARLKKNPPESFV